MCAIKSHISKLPLTALPGLLFIAANIVALAGILGGEIKGRCATLQWKIKAK